NGYKNNDSENNNSENNDSKDNDSENNDSENNDSENNSDSENKDPTPFFTNDTLDSHISLAINIDWFQLFDYTVHSTGVIYRVLSPIVDELVDFASGIDLLAIFEYKKGRKIYVALILSSNDVPATRKICDHTSHTVKYYRCLKCATYDNLSKEVTI
ncbi:8216_t:CDS:2, partial [Scutellospora calospora]